MDSSVSVHVETHTHVNMQNTHTEQTEHTHPHYNGAPRSEETETYFFMCIEVSYQYITADCTVSSFLSSLKQGCLNFLYIFKGSVHPNYTEEFPHVPQAMAAHADSLGFVRQ